MAAIINYLFHGRDIKALNKEEKIELMSILISVLIEKADPRQKSKIHPKTLSDVVGIKSGGDLIDYDSMPDTALINTIAKLLIKKEDGSNLEIHEAGNIICVALKDSPDKTLPDGTSTVLLKSKFINDNFQEILKEDRDLKRAAMYVEFLPELTVQKMISKINPKEYVQASEKANYSDYVVLSIGMLRGLFQEIKNIKFRGKDQIIINKLLNGEIERDYFELNYEDCMNKIIDCARALKRNLNKQGSKEVSKIDEVCEKIIEARKSCSEVDPDKNDTRRYYETKLSQYLLGTMGSSDKIESINHILQMILKRKADSVHAVEEEISRLGSSNFGTAEMRDELQGGSPKFQKCKKEKKLGFENRMLADDNIFTQNLGAMRSSAPNFRDEVTKNSLRNRTVDTHLFPREEMDIRKARSAYIADISGHAFYMVAILEKYSRENPGPTLEKDVNNFLLALVAIYIKRGFHGLHEMLDVFREQNVVKVLGDCRVKIKLTLHPSVLQKAMNDTLAYSKTVSLKKSMFIEITKKAWIMMSDLAFKKEMQWLKGEFENPKLIREMLVDPRKRDSINKKKIILQNIINSRPDEALLINELLDIIDKIYFQINFYEIMNEEDLGRLRDRLRAFIVEPRSLKYIDTLAIHVTLIHDASSLESLDIAKIDIAKHLIEIGVNLKLVNDLGRISGDKVSQEEKNIALTSAVQIGSKDSVLALLKMGADINYHLRPHGETPLMLAVNEGHFEIFSALLKASPNLIETDTTGLIVLHYALFKNRELMVQAILDAVLNMEDLAFILNAGHPRNTPLDIVRDLKDPTLIKIIEDAHKRLGEWKKISESKDKSEQDTIIDLKGVTENQEKMDANKKATSVTFQYGSISEEGKAAVVPMAPKPPSTTG